MIPAYQAARTIGAVLAGIPSWVRFIVVVDDASTDGTADAARNAADDRTEVIVHDQNGGVGAAVLTGYTAAVARGAEILVKMDADDQMDPAALPALVMPIIRGEADYVKANRFLHARQLGSMPATRRFGNVMLSFLTKLASGYWPIFDPTNGYTALHASVFKILDRDAVAKRFFFETSLLLELSRARAVVLDAYVPARYPGTQSHLSPRRAATEFPPRLFRGFLRRIVLQYFVRDFTAVSLYIVAGIVLSLFGFVWGVWHWVLSIQTGVPATTGTVMLAVLPLILGVQLLLQAVALDIDSVPTRPLHRASALADA